MSKSQIVRELVLYQPGYIMKAGRDRRKFAKELCEALEFWSLEEMNNFVDEMRGLSFANPVDRQTFLQFLSCWIGLEVAA